MELHVESVDAHAFQVFYSGDNFMLFKLSLIWWVVGGH